MTADIDDFGVSPEVARRPRGRLPSWARRNVPGVGGRWVRLRGRTYYAARRETRRELPPGMYTLGVDHEGDVLFQGRDLAVDALIRLPGSAAEGLLCEIAGFWSLGPTFAAHGFLHRRGYLLYGPQGCGKTSIVRQAIQDLIARGGVVFLCGAPVVLGRALLVFRRVEPERPCACVFEDLDAIVREHGEDRLLSLLDGEDQVDHVLNLATTNYPEHLDRRFVGRPRRFDRIIRIDTADQATRRAYLAGRLGDADAPEVERWVQATEGLSLAALAEAVISVRCFGRGLEETVELLRRMSAGRASSREFAPGAGFANAGR